MPRRKRNATDSTVINVAEEMGQAVGKAMAALGSIGTRKRHPNGYARLARKRQRAESPDRAQRDASADSPGRTRRRKPAARKPGRSKKPR